MADMDSILRLAGQYGLTVIEDACQAHGAEYFSKKLNRWMKAGSMGRAAAFSFYPGKNLGACGEAGAVTTNDPDVADKIKMLRDHGQVEEVPPRRRRLQRTAGRDPSRASARKAGSSGEVEHAAPRPGSRIQPSSGEQ